MNEQKNNPVYVRIENPLEKRRFLLNSTIKTIVLLRKYEKFIRIKKEKDQRKKELKSIMGQIKDLFIEIENMLPTLGGEAKRERLERIDVQNFARKDIYGSKLEKDLADLKSKISQL